MKYLFLILFIGGVSLFYSQTVGVNATGAVPSTSAMLDVSATNKGLLIPRVDIVDLGTALPIVSPAVSL